MHAVNTNKITMSNEETLFYIKHITKFSLGEAEAIRLILKLVSEQINSPDKIDSRLHDQFPNWSSSQRATNRSGVIGRATDLRLLGKSKKASEVIYTLSDLGKDSLGILEKS